MTSSRRIVLLLTASVCLSGTVDARHFEHKDHHLGPTGLFGVTSPKAITISKVQDGSPAAGNIKVGDVITGAGGAMFKENARRELADAIDAAETQSARGILALTLKDGRKVQLQLKVLGSYSDTAPFDCAKTDAIITQTADYLVKSGKFGRGDMNIGLLGLLATGEQKYIDVVKGKIHGAAWAKPDVQCVEQLKTGGRHAWGWGYTNLLLCEYYLLTGDTYVLPAIKEYSTAIAMGRDAAGLWGHGMAYLEPNRGQYHGRLFGYAQINQPSLVLLNSLILAEKCGVKHPELRAAVEQTHAFYDSFVGRGALPYGVHNPFAKAFNNNGTSGSAAVAMALKGNTRGAAFFSRMCMASYDGLESGHTGHFFNQLWTGLGAGCSGPEAASAFFHKTRWLHTLNRTWDGNFTYDCCEYNTPVYSYRGLSDAGSHLLNYGLGRRALYITGRQGDPSIWLKGQGINVAMALGTINYEDKRDEELLALFGHPMPQVRIPALWTLRSREHQHLPAIRKMIKAGTREQRESAISYFGWQCPQDVALAAMEDLGSVLRDPGEDPELRAAAAASLCWLGEAAYPFYATMLAIVAEDEPDDPLGAIDESVGGSMTTLCKDPFAAGLVQDKDLFFKAVLKLLDHKRQSGRTTGMTLIANMPIEDFHRVADKLLYIIEDQDLSYHSYHNYGPRGGAITVLANLHIKGGIEYALDIFNSPTGKAGFKIRMCLDVFPRYGANAQYALPQIKAIQAGKFQKQWDEMIKNIESSTKTSEMISFEQARQAGLKKTK